MDEAILSVSLGIFVVAFVILVIVNTVKSIRNMKKRTVQAEVISKEIKRPYSKAIAKARISGVDWFEFYAVFRTEKGKKLELQMPKEIYDAIEESDKGQLTYKGHYFISFDRNSAFFV